MAGNNSGNTPRKIQQLGETVERSRGCWNCKQWDNEKKAIAHWSQSRQRDLGKMAELALVEPDGENSPAVRSMRQIIDQVDRAVAQGMFGICMVEGAEADLCHHAFLCERWSGKEGSSLATSGTAPDLLPAELLAKKRDGSGGKS